MFSDAQINNFFIPVFFFSAIHHVWTLLVDGMGPLLMHSTRFDTLYQAYFNVQRAYLYAAFVEYVNNKIMFNRVPLV